MDSCHLPIESFGHGKSTEELLKSGKLNLETPSFGNGATMRLAPLILFYGLREAKVVAEAAAISTLFTHAHISCRDSARLLSLITWHFLHGYTKDEVLGPWGGKSSDLLNPFISELGVTFPDIIKLFEEPNKPVIDSDDPKLYSESSHGSLHLAIHALLNTNNYFDGLKMCVKFGFDTDTVATVYGMMAGALYGFSGIDKWMIDDLYAAPAFSQLSCALLTLAQNPDANLIPKFPDIIICRWGVN